MQEVINILGSLNAWLMWGNLAAIIVLSYTLRALVARIDRLDDRISRGEKGLDRVAGGLASMAKRVYGKGKKL